MRAFLHKLVALGGLLATALVLTTVTAPTAHADCLMVGKPDLGEAAALLNNYALQFDCNGQFRMWGYLEDGASDHRTATLSVDGYRSDGSRAWHYSTEASGYGKTTYFDLFRPKVFRVYLYVVAKNAWGSSKAHDRWHYVN